MCTAAVVDAQDVTTCHAHLHAASAVPHADAPLAGQRSHFSVIRNAQQQAAGAQYGRAPVWSRN